VLCVAWCSGVAAVAKPFVLPKDTFSYSNNLYYDYHADPTGMVTIRKRAKGTEPDYSRHCFSMTRAVVQFYRFAEFRPDIPPISEQEYQILIRKVCRIPPWQPTSPEKIIFPGYSDLHSFSQARTLLLQKNLGVWWPSYWRIGNWRMVLPQPRSGQARFAVWLKNRIDERALQTVFITRFQPINHCLVAYAYHVEPDQDVIFSVYDCNQPDKLVHLRFRAADKSFYLDKTWYYTAGRVNALSLYVSPLF
jgi:hypothetical protein